MGTLSSSSPTAIHLCSKHSLFIVMAPATNWYYRFCMADGLYGRVYSNFEAPYLASQASLRSFLPWASRNHNQLSLISVPHKQSLISVPLSLPPIPPSSPLSLSWAYLGLVLDFWNMNLHVHEPTQPWLTHLSLPLPCWLSCK